ncbi:hypothetical protein V8E36_000698 [Tilletia maclaganii]
MDHPQRVHDVANLDTAVLKVAANHARTVLKQPQLVQQTQVLSGHYCACLPCSRCIKESTFTVVPEFSYVNACWLGSQPSQLSDLTYVESLAVARARGTKCFIKLEKGPHGQSAAMGNVCVLPQEPRRLAEILPPPLSELSDEIVVVFVSDASTEVKTETLMRSPLLLRRGKILEALQWLQVNNPLYRDVHIDNDAL